MHFFFSIIRWNVEKARRKKIAIKLSETIKKDKLSEEEEEEGKIQGKEKGDSKRVSRVAAKAEPTVK